MPATVPVTTPVDDPIVAVPAVLLIHVPPAVALVRARVAPSHTLKAIVPAMIVSGMRLTVIIDIAMQPPVVV